MTAHTMTHNGFRLERSARSLGRNLPQRAGQVLWLPMLVLALMAFPLALALAWARSAAVSAGEAEAVAALGHFVPAATFLGFAAVFAAVSFAIANILGQLRDGGGRVQEAAGEDVQTLSMPITAKAFLVGMAMAMMILLGAVIAHVVVGVGILDGDVGLLADAEAWAIGLEAVRRFGVALFLGSILLGLATIATVLRFQTLRLREIAADDDG